MKIKKHSNGTYWFSISLGFDAVTGNRKQTTRNGFKTKKEAEHEYIRLKHLNNKGQYKHSSHSVLPFSTLLEIYANERKDKVKITTFNNEQGRINFHIAPYFEHANLIKISRNELLEFREYLQKNELSNNTINKIMLALKMILDVAVLHGYLQYSPYQNIKQLKVEKVKMNFWTPNEFQNFIESVEKTESTLIQLFFIFAYLTGARRSEILGCQWNDINLYTSTWRLENSLNYDKEKREYYLDDTKTTTSTRSISLPSKLMLLLKKEKELAQSTFIFAESSEFPNGRYLDRIFYNHIKLSKVKKIRFHDLRHSHVALLIDMGEQDFIIKERLGHSSIKITYDIYGHLFPTRQKELADRLDKIF